MKKIYTLIIAMLICSIANSQILYEISGNGLKKKSYIIGTCHIVANTFVDTIPGAKKVLNKVEQVCGELETKYMQNPDTIKAVVASILLPGDTTLKMLMSEEQFNHLTKLVYDNYKIDLNQPKMSILLKIHPKFFIYVIPELKNYFEGKNTGSENMLDNYFQEEAIKAGKSIVSLETYDYQLNLFINSSDSLEKQISDMIEYFEKSQENNNLLNELIKYYKEQNLEKLEILIKKLIQEGKDFESKFITIRNQNWSKKIPSIITEKSTLFVVGAGHLVGEKSILQLLKNQGYKIKAVKK